MLAHDYLSAEDLWALSDNEVKRELLRGELIEMPPPGEEHGGIAANLVAVLHPWARGSGLEARVLVETGFVLERGPDTVRSPDVSLRLAPGPLSKAFVEGPPDLAVEIVSPSDRLAAIRRKAEAYLEAGMRGVWVVDPRRRQLWVYAPECEPHVLGPNDMLDGGLLLPGFDVRVGVLFE